MRVETKASTSSQYITDAPDDDEQDEQDVHTCGKCKLLFTSLETYLEHKMSSKSCGKQLVENRKNILKQLGPRRGRPPGRKRQHHDGIYNRALVKKEVEGAESSESRDDLESASYPTEKPEKYNRLKLDHRISDIIPNSVLYQCDKCDRNFRREAALNRHKEYDHRVKDSDESESSGEENEDGPVFVISADQPTTTDNSSLGLHQVSVVKQQPDESAPEVHYVETLIFDPDTGLYTTSATPTIIETDGSYVLPTAETPVEEPATEQLIPATEQLMPVDQQSDNVKADPDYVERKIINYMRSGRKMTPVSRRGTHRSTNNSKLVCFKCGKYFANAMSLGAHQITHFSARDYKCTITGCPYAFKTKGSLKRHMRRHTGERPFICTLCDRAFRESGALTRHLKGRIPCTERTDSDYPRYKKNLKFTVDVANKDTSVPVIDTQLEQLQQAAEQQSPGIIKLDSNSDSIYQVVHRDEAGLGGSREIILVPVSEDNTLQHEQTELIVKHSSTSVHPQVLPEHVDMDNDNEIVMTVSEDDLNAHQGLSLVIEDTGEDDKDYVVEEDQYSDQSAQDFEDHSLADEADTNTARNVLYIEAGELVKDQGDKPSAIAQPVQIKRESLGDDGESFTCMVDGRMFSKSTEFVDHLKTHLLNVNYHCNKCNYSSESAAEMDGHIQLTHLKQWLTQPHDSVITPVLKEEQANVQDLVVIPSSTTQNTQNIHFLAAENEVSEEIVPHGDEVTMATSAIETVENEEVTDGSQITLSHIHDTDQPMEEAQPHSETYAVEQSSNQQVPDGSGINTADRIQIAKIALEQLLTLYEPAESQLDGNQQEKAMCPVCGKKFKSHPYLKFHLRTHTGEKHYQCNQCEKTFGTKDALNKHYTAHSMDRNYKCGECGKFFKRISHVREHLKVHTNERPYACKVCKKTFKTVNACKVHLRTHTKDLNFKCEVCQRHFREKASLDRHVRVHTGEKPFPCPHCGKKFAEHGTLSRHLKAKVPCTRDLQELRLTSDVGQVGTSSRQLQVQVPYTKDLQDLRLTNEVSQLSLVPQSIINGAGSVSMETSDVLKIMEISNDGSLETHVDGRLNRQHIKLHILPDGQMKEEHVIKADETTVLTEFSSVVADTQQYIIDARQQDNTEYMMVSEQQQNVVLQNNMSISQGNVQAVPQDSIVTASHGTLQIVSQQNMAGLSQEVASQGDSDEHVEYIVMDEGRMDNIIFIDQKTGQQIHLLPSDANNQMVMENLEVVGGSSVQREIMASSAQEIIAMQTDATELMPQEDVVQEEGVSQEVYHNNDDSEHIMTIQNT